MKAIIIGATGATGSELLKLLLEDKDFHQIDIFVRRSISLEHPKLNVYKIDFEKPEEWKHFVKGDVLFSCLGTTLKDAGCKEKQWKVDFDYQYQFAKIAKENGVSIYVLVSSASASPNSPFFYLRMKGQLEETIKQLDFNHTIIFKPPLLIRGDNKRTGEVIAYNILKILNQLGLFLSSKPLETHLLAKAMIIASKNIKNKLQIIEGQEIRKLALEST
ncbi:MAG: oxidoreductase [Leptospiraceae bacterium]|nr:MAG: oxidoreductase [Leptospiraceae bacterium]